MSTGTGKKRGYSALQYPFMNTDPSHLTIDFKYNSDETTNNKKVMITVQCSNRPMAEVGEYFIGFDGDLYGKPWPSEGAAFGEVQFRPITKHNGGFGGGYTVHTVEPSEPINAQIKQRALAILKRRREFEAPQRKKRKVCVDDD